jgi:CheY-like chemotaxis protein
MTNTKILCVENHPEYADALKDMLESAGYEVLSAKTGGRAIELISTQSSFGNWDVSVPV